MSDRKQQFRNNCNLFPSDGTEKICPDCRGRGRNRSGHVRDVRVVVTIRMMKRLAGRLGPVVSVEETGKTLDESVSLVFTLSITVGCSHTAQGPDAARTAGTAKLYWRKRSTLPLSVSSPPSSRPDRSTLRIPQPSAEPSLQRRLLPCGGRVLMRVPPAVSPTGPVYSHTACEDRHKVLSSEVGP